MSYNLTDLTLTQALSQLRSRQISAVDLTRAHLERIEKLNPHLKAFLTVLLLPARAVQRQIRRR